MVGDNTVSTSASSAASQGTPAAAGGATDTTSSTSTTATTEASNAGGATGATGSDGSGSGSSAAGAAGDAGGGDEPEVPEVTVPPLLAITEYVEGTSNNKAIEVSYLGTEAASTAGCRLELYFNGSPEPRAELGLGLLSTPDDPLVLCNPRSAEGILERCDVPDNGVSFNGDDTLVIRCDDVVIDVFGQVGFAPESGYWEEGELRTADQTLRRNCPTKLNDLDDGTFTPADYFSSLGLDVFDDLNSFSCE
jgi:hypothetical protein